MREESFLSFSHPQLPYTIETDPAALDITAIHAYLHTAYWCEGVIEKVVERAIRNSTCFGLFDQNDAQIGFARVVTDLATTGYIKDVYVLESHQGQGLGRWLIETLLAHPDLRDLRSWTLATHDMHDLYAKFGFTPLPDPSRIMVCSHPEQPRYLGQVVD